MKLSSLILSLGFLMRPAARARADVVVFPNDVRMDGILTAAGDGTTELQVSANGFVGLDTATVVSVLKQSAAENARLRSQWADQDLKAVAVAKVRLELVERQRAKGLVPYRGEWVTTAEFDRRLALEELDVQRERAEHPATAVQEVVVVADQQANASSVYLYYLPHRGKRFYSAEFGVPRRINPYSSSGNIIRASEFVRPNVHPGTNFFDPSTGLYR
jgi:hypothetical protein